MGDVVSSHLDEAKRDKISARSGEVMGELGRLYERQYAVALFNKVRFDVEGGGGPQPQLLHRKVPLENKSIFSGSIFQYLEDNRKWRNRFLFVPDSYNIHYYDNKAAHDKHLQPKGIINCAGYKVLTSLDDYLELISNSLPGVKAKVGSSPFLKVATPFPLFLWHPYAKHFYFCLGTEKEQNKWSAVLQDCVRHANDGLSEENKVQTPAFTDAVRLYRQAEGNYGTWEMMCGMPTQILSNLVMEGLLPELRDLISPKLKGKLHDRQRNWMLISDAVYSLVQADCETRYQALLQKCEASRSSLEASIRTDMDQIITSKEHVTNKIRAVVLPKAEKLLKVSIQPYISSILDALMEPTSRGFVEVRDVFFKELVDMSRNTKNEGAKEAVAQHMEKISMLAFHPVKMQSCYEKMEPLSLEGLQQRFDVSSPSVFVQRAQILMREQMDDAVYTFEQILHQSLEAQSSEGLCKTIQRCQDRVIKKFDYDSSTVRKRFFREALLQIFIPYMLKQLNPSVSPELPRFQELIFEDFSRFILVENIFEEVVLHSVMKDITMAVKEAAVQRRHNLYRDSIVLSSSDPSLQLLGENPSIDWAGEYGGSAEEQQEEEEEEVTDGPGEGEGGESQKRRRMKQVVSMIQVDGAALLPGESCLEVPGVDDIPEEEEEEDDEGEESSPEASEILPEMSNGSVVKVEESEKAASAKAGGSAPREEQKNIPASSPEPSEPSESPSGTSNGSVVKGDEDKPQEEGKEDSLFVEKEKASSPEPSEASTTVSNGSEVTLEEPKGEANGEAKESDKGEANEEAKESDKGEANEEAKESDKEEANGEAKESDKGEAKESDKGEANGEAKDKAPPKAEESSPAVEEKKSLTAEPSEVPPDMSNGSVEEAKEVVPPKAEEGSSSREEEEEEKASTPKPSETPSVMSNGSVLTEEDAADKEVLPSEAEKEDPKKVVEDLPPPNQEESEELLPPPPPPPPPEENTLSETSPESLPEAPSDFPVPPIQDGGFQSPSSEEVDGKPKEVEKVEKEVEKVEEEVEKVEEEVEKVEEEVEKVEEEVEKVKVEKVEEVSSKRSSGEKEANVAAEPKTSDSESKDQ